MLFSTHFIEHIASFDKNTAKECCGTARRKHGPSRGISSDSAERAASVVDCVKVM